MDGRDTGLIVLDRVIRHPIALIISSHAWFSAPIIVSGQERLISLTLTFQRLQFRGHIDRSVLVISNVEWYHADGVAGNQKSILLLVIEHKSEDAAEVFQKTNALLTVKGEDHLAIALRLKRILSGKPAAGLLMVVDLTVHRQHLFTVR